jgi:hypothetical protein
LEEHTKTAFSVAKARINMNRTLAFGTLPARAAWAACGAGNPVVPQRAFMTPRIP